VYASTSALDRLGRISVRLPGRNFEPSGRSDLGSRKPISVLQSQPIFRIARGRVQRGAQPNLGMDVHPGLKVSRERLQETADFLRSRVM
jgi:hypothetical protein